MPASPPLDCVPTRTPANLIPAPSPAPAPTPAAIAAAAAAAASAAVAAAAAAPSPDPAPATPPTAITGAATRAAANAGIGPASPYRYASAPVLVPLLLFLLLLLLLMLLLFLLLLLLPSQLQLPLLALSTYCCRLPSRQPCSHALPLCVKNSPPSTVTTTTPSPSTVTLLILSLLHCYTAPTSSADEWQKNEPNGRIPRQGSPNSSPGGNQAPLSLPVKLCRPSLQLQPSTYLARKPESLNTCPEKPNARAPQQAQLS